MGKPPVGQTEPVVPLTEIDPRGLLITNAEIRGHLDLMNAAISSAVTITRSNFSDGITLAGARMDRGLDLTDSTVSTMDLTGTAIAGELVMSGAHLGIDQDGDSLVADNLQVEGSAFLDKSPDQRFTAAGAVHLAGARITGQLKMAGAQLGANHDGDSLFAQSLQVDGGALLYEGFTAAGAVNLHGARITGQLSMRSAQLGASEDASNSLLADNLQVEGNAFLDKSPDQRFTAAGAVRLHAARITGQLKMAGAQLGANHDGDSLFAQSLQVDGGAFLDEGFTAAGAVRLRGARITGQLRTRAAGMRPAAVDSPGLDLTGAAVDDLCIDLSGVDWIDRPKVRPDPPSLPTQRVVLSLENCTYKTRPDPTLGNLETWLRVLRFHTPDYQPRSYQNLASVHRATGHDRDAGCILMAQQDHRRAVALRPQPDARLLHRVGLWTIRTGLAIWKATLGYGYRARRALVWLLALLATAGLLVTVAAHWQADPTNPDVPVAYHPANPDTGAPLGYCSAGEAAGLAVRIAIPLVTNLGQGACLINTASTPGSVIVAVSIALQTFAWILGGLTVAAAATAIKRSP